MSALAAAYRDWFSAWESWVITPTKFIAVDDARVLVLPDVEARTKTHRVEVSVEAANLLTLKDGRLARLELFNAPDEGLEAAGLTA